MNTGTLASQAEIGGWVQALGPGMSAGGRRPFPLRESGVSPTEKKFEIVYAKSCNLVRFWPDNRSQCCPQCDLKHFNDGTTFSRVPPRNDPCSKHVAVIVKGYFYSHWNRPYNNGYLCLLTRQFETSLLYLLGRQRIVSRSKTFISIHTEQTFMRTLSDFRATRNAINVKIG